MRLPVAALVAFVSALQGCGRAADAPADAPAPVEAGAAPTEERLVVLRAGPLHVDPDPASPGLAEVSAGTVLRVVAGPARPGWVRVATWDDRRGWIPEDRLVPTALWSEYGRALGGVSPVLLRPAYPVGGGRWGVEAPLGSPGITPASTVWVVGDSAASVRVVSIDSVASPCTGRLHRFGILDARAERGAEPRLERGRLAAPSGDAPALRPAAVGALEPDPDLVALLAAAARAIAPDAGPPAATAWAALGPDAAWVALAWPSERSAALVFRRTAAGWERASGIPPTPTSAPIPDPAWAPVGAWSAGAATHPTILLLEAREREGSRLDLWIERGGSYTRLYEGVSWGCRGPL